MDKYSYIEDNNGKNMLITYIFSNLFWSFDIINVKYKDN